MDIASVTVFRIFRLQRRQKIAKSVPFDMRLSARLLLLIMLPSLLFVEGCICELSGVNRGDINLISHDQEWELGAQLAEEIRRQTEIVEDPTIRKYVEEMGARIVEETELADRPWEFHVVRDSSVNAFNIPGGHVFVHTGLIRAAETPSELAGVVAHEVAHGVARHATEQMTQAYGMNLIFSLIAGEEVTILEQLAGRLIGSGAMAKFSRDDEREADRLGLLYMTDADYVPEGMVNMFETMLQLRRRRPNIVEQFFSTHPLTEERIEEMKTRAGEMERSKADTDEALFERIQRRVGSER